MIMKTIFTLVICSFLSITALGQKDVPFDKNLFKDRKDEFKAAKKQLEEGDAYFEGRSNKFMVPQYIDAIEPYEKAYEFNPNSADLNLKLGICYMNSFHKYHSLDFFKKAYKLKNTVDPMIHFYLGSAYHIQYKFDKAIQEYEYYRKTLNQKTHAEEIFGVQKNIKQCKTGKKMYNDPVRVWIDNLGENVNSSHGDYAPVITTDQSRIFFTSRREGSTGEKMDDQTGDYFEDVYYCDYKDGKWQPAVNMGKEINSSNHDASAGLSPDGKKLIIYLGHEGMGDLFVTQQKDGHWSKLKSIGKNINTKYWEPSASISHDGKTLYYVSNKPGGHGELDIYKSAWNEEKERWEEGVNLGPTVNTKYNDRSVFIHPDGKTMYFSSQGHDGMGGYDIFYSVLGEDGNWSKPKNIGYPISTPDDDVNFVMSANGREGYFVSFHEDGLGEKDIYKVTFLGPEKEPLLNNEDNLLASVASPVKEKVVVPKVEVQRSDVAVLKGVVRDEKTKKTLASVIEIIDNETNQVVSTLNTDAADGKYLVTLPSGKNYGMAVKSADYLFHSENFLLPAASGYREYKKDIDLKKVEVGAKIVLRNIFYDLNKATLRPESKTELERLIKLMNDNPTLKIELSGHTDSRGDAGYNKTLSQKRAKSVVDYLVDHGISGDRLKSAGYGETQLIISDADIYKLPKSQREEAHQQNRRTEFEILSK